MEECCSVRVEADNGKAGFIYKDVHIYLCLSDDFY